MNNILTQLIKIVNNNGYKIDFCPYMMNNGDINHTKKVITINSRNNNKENVILLHEIGHIYEYKISKYFILLSEVMAWVIGYLICIFYRLNVKNYWSTAKECIKTYIDKL